MPSPVKLIAFYLPQYHPIPENDQWWGKGFTEWTNVVKARPLFGGHYQPHLPADLGFYDLRLPEARQAQADLAREYGVHGFCYYHYWFNGRRLLERPFTEVLESGRPDFPFCLCWANENWTRAWDGGAQQVLVGQEYSPEDDLNHIRHLAQAFADPRYIRVAGKPMFLVYRVGKMPDPIGTTTRWREEAARLGVGDLFLCRVDSFSTEIDTPASSGFDAAVEFQPQWGGVGMPLRRCHPVFWRLFEALGLGSRAYRDHAIREYRTLVDMMTKQVPPNYQRFPCVTPQWDNTPRRKRKGVVFRDSTPELYAQWLRNCIEAPGARIGDDRVVFVNAWNEWGEGNHLEPCQKWGHAYLEATRDALRAAVLKDGEASLGHSTPQS